VGYYAPPILHGDRTIARLDARANRDGRVLRAAAIHRLLLFSKAKLEVTGARNT